VCEKADGPPCGPDAATPAAVASLALDNDQRPNKNPIDIGFSILRLRRRFVQCRANI
jgi:hypothetical protein